MPKEVTVILISFVHSFLSFQKNERITSLTHQLCQVRSGMFLVSTGARASLLARLSITRHQGPTA